MISSIVSAVNKECSSLDIVSTISQYAGIVNVALNISLIILFLLLCTCFCCYARSDKYSIGNKLELTSKL